MRRLYIESFLRSTKHQILGFILYAYLVELRLFYGIVNAVIYSVYEYCSMVFCRSMCTLWYKKMFTIKRLSNSFSGCITVMHVWWTQLKYFSWICNLVLSFSGIFNVFVYRLTCYLSFQTLYKVLYTS